MLVRADSAYYGYDIIAACRRAGARFSVTARLTPTVVAAITSIHEQAWTPIRYPNAICDEDEQRWVSDAEVAEVGVHRVHRPPQGRARHRPADRAPGPAAQPRNAPSRPGRPKLFAVYRYHAVFTDSAEPMLAAEATHRDHAIIEQVIAELKNGPLAHLPSGVFTANAAWLVCAAIAHNLTRAAGALAGGRHARSPHRDHAHPADPHPGPDRALRAPPGPAPTPRLALGARAGRAVPPRPARPPPRHRLTTAPTRARPEITSGRAGQTGSSTTPDQHHANNEDQLHATSSRSTVDPGSAQMVNIVEAR